MIAADRDLLLLEPNLFRDISWTGQRLVNGTAQIEGNTLKFTTLDVPLDAAAIVPGFVVTVGLTSYEVVEVISDSQLGVSMLRPEENGPIISVAEVTVSTTTTITSFSPQIAIVHRQIMRMLGIEHGTPVLPGVPGELNIINLSAIRRLEALGALHLIYTAAGSLTPTTSAINSRAELYRERFAQERERIVVHFDLNGDGRPDSSRKLNVSQFVRA